VSEAAQVNSCKRNKYIESWRIDAFISASQKATLLLPVSATPARASAADWLQAQDCSAMSARR
jgi:aspartate aminotransferase-like enzyme